MVGTKSPQKPPNAYQQATVALIAHPETHAYSSSSNPVAAHSEALAILKTFIASGYGPENVLVVTVRRLCNRTAEREAAEQAEVERLAEKARLFPFKDVHAQLTELTHQTLKVVDPMEAARFALLVEGTPMPPMAEEVTADTSGRASSANGSEALSLPFQRAPKAQRQHDRLMLGAAGAAA